MGDLVVLPLKAQNGEYFKYRKTAKIVSLLNEINDLYLKNDMKPFNLVYEYESLSTCSLDNGDTTIPDTLRLLEKGRVEKKKENTILNTLNILRLGLLDNISINKEDVILLWRYLTRDALSNKFLGLNQQGYRVTPVYVGKSTVVEYVPPNPTKVNNLMEDLYYYANNVNENPIIQAIIFHFYFVYVHPFCDGNGRTSRLLLNKVLIDKGLSKFKYISITSEVKKHTIEYNNALKLCETNPDCLLTSFIEFYLGIIKDVIYNINEGVYVKGIDTNIERSLALISIEKFLKFTHHNSTEIELLNYLNTHGFSLTLKECREIILEGLNLKTIILNSNVKSQRYCYNFNRRG